MKIKSADFIRSYTNVESIPDDGYPEYAFIGSSNVGKSSLINMLAGRKALAKTSSQPGKTLLLNQFLINQSWYLMDLPGYGFANVSKVKRREVKTMVDMYVQGRGQLTCLFLLLDSRRSPQKSDIEFSLFAGECEIPVAYIFTKCDKISKNKVNSCGAGLRKIMKEYWANEMPPVFYSSAKNGTGKKEILDYIGAISLSLKQGTIEGRQT